VIAPRFVGGFEYMSTDSHNGTDGRKTILVADDDPSVLQAIDSMLKTRGYDTILAHDGAQAVELFRQHRQAIVAIVLDLRMPNKDGIEAATEIRRDSPDIPLVALSAHFGGHDGPGILKRCQEAGFDAYTSKPFSMEPFLSTLADSIQRRGGARPQSGPGPMGKAKPSS
jgi:CheY-like chemotaxis protein